MKNKKKNKLIIYICCIIGLAILLSFGLSACWKGYTDAESFKRSWGITIPENMEREYFKSNEQSIAGQNDGTRYWVFKLESEPTDFLKDFSREKDEKLEESVNNIISWVSFEIQEEFLPDWETEYYHKHIGRQKFIDSESYAHNLYMIYYPDTLKLIICVRLL